MQRKGHLQCHIHKEQGSALHRPANLLQNLLWYVPPFSSLKEPHTSWLFPELAVWTSEKTKSCASWKSCWEGEGTTAIPDLGRGKLAGRQFHFHYFVPHMSSNRIDLEASSHGQVTETWIQSPGNFSQILWVHCLPPFSSKDDASNTDATLE